MGRPGAVCFVCSFAFLRFGSLRLLCAVRNVACSLVCAQSRVSHVWHAVDKLRKAHGPPSFICAQSRMSHGRVWHAVEKKTKEATLGSGRGSTIVGDHMGRPAHGEGPVLRVLFLYAPTPLTPYVLNKRSHPTRKLN